MPQDAATPLLGNPASITPNTRKLHVSFESLGLSEPILQGIRQAGYDSPTDIQQQAIPIVLDGGDLIGLGQTGSGKTAAFGLPLLDKLVEGEPGLRALIMVPTRELCVQVAENLRGYAAATDLHVCTAFGGIDMGIQESAYKRGIDVLVACPGRLIDHLERRNLTLEKVEIVVLDEADRMLDMGFMPQIRKVFQRTPDERQNLLFSATMPPEIEALCKDFMRGAERVQIGGLSEGASTISHRFLNVATADKTRVLERLLKETAGKVLVFVKRKTSADKLGRDLARRGFPADSIHGDKGAEARHVVLRGFDRGKIKYLIATDVAGRGIDVDDIELVVNYDMPFALEDYVHRTGRTGRAGREGSAISLVSKMEMGIYREVQGHLKDPSKTKPASERSQSPGAGGQRGGSRGGRPSGNSRGGRSVAGRR